MTRAFKLAWRAPLIVLRTFARRRKDDAGPSTADQVSGCCVHQRGAGLSGIGAERAPAGHTGVGDGKVRWEQCDVLPLLCVA